jgi:hypothetical protein
MLGALVTVGGLVLGTWGVVTALRGRRPASLGGALLAALGLALALMGVTRLLVPSFF